MEAVGVHPSREKVLGIVSNDQLPGDLDRLLNEHVHSYEELDVLLLLHRTGRSRPWTPETVAGELKISEDSAVGALEGLRARGLVSSGPEPGGFRYEPSRPDLDEAVIKLARLHSENRFAIVHSMSKHALDRVRHSVLHALVDGFLQPEPKKDRR